MWQPGHVTDQGGAETLTSEPAAAQLMRLLLGLAIQKVEVALQVEMWREERIEFCYRIDFGSFLIKRGNQ